MLHQIWKKTGSNAHLLTLLNHQRAFLVKNTSLEQHQFQHQIYQFFTEHLFGLLAGSSEEEKTSS